jgi:hypothetical protein
LEAVMQLQCLKNMPDSMHILQWLVLSEDRLEIDGQTVWEAEDVGDFSANMKALYHHLGLQYSKFYKMDNLSKFGFLAAEALLSRNPQKEDWDLSKTGVFLANASSSLDTDKKYFATVNPEGERLPSPALFVYTLPNILIGEICIRHKFTGEQAFFVSSHFDSGYLYPYLTQLFQNGYLDQALVGWVEIEATKPISKMVLLCSTKSQNSRTYSQQEMSTFFKNEL